MSVYQKFLEVQKAVRSLSKDSNASTYQYVSGSKLMNIVRPKMDEVGLICLPEITDIANQPITYNTARGTKTEMFTSIKMRFTWVDPEDGSSFTADFAANGMNVWDKGLGSALTYGERYYFLKAFHIATDKDDVDALEKEEAISIIPQPVEPEAPRKRPCSPAQFEKICKRIENGEAIITSTKEFFVLTPEQQEIISKYEGK